MRPASFPVLLALSATPAIALEVPPQTHWTHGRSQVTMSEGAGGRITLVYNGASPSPRGPTMPRGTLLFEGVRQGDRIVGTARTFKDGCAPTPYRVEGRIRLFGPGDGEIELAGAAPKRGSGCNIVGLTTASPHARLLFDNPDLRD